MADRFPDQFADAEAGLDDAAVVVVGAPYEATVSYRGGTSAGPRAIRQASWNFETYNLRNGVDLRDVAIHDMGDLPIDGLAPAKMAEVVQNGIEQAVGHGRFPILLGGEHSITPHAVKALHEHHDELVVVAIDAHVDYRDEYEGEPLSHACASRRCAEIVGARNTAWIGVRSAQREEWQAAQRDRLRVVTAHQARALGFARALDVALGKMSRTAPVYLTIDIDGFDMAYAPGTGTPDPFGLTPYEGLHLISRLAPRLVGMDVVEVAPEYDQGTSALLAARVARETIAEREARDR